MGLKKCIVGVKVIVPSFAEKKNKKQKTKNKKQKNGPYNVVGFSLLTFNWLLCFPNPLLGCMAFTIRMASLMSQLEFWSLDPMR